MRLDDERNEHAPETRSDWAVVRCAHGMLHLQLGRLTLDFSPREFHDLARLVGNAYAEFDVRRAVIRDLGPAH